MVFFITHTFHGDCGSIFPHKKKCECFVSILCKRLLTSGSVLSHPSFHFRKFRIEGPERMDVRGVASMDIMVEDCVPLYVVQKTNKDLGYSIKVSDNKVLSHMIRRREVCKCDIDNNRYVIHK